MSGLRWKFLGLALWGSCFTAPAMFADEPAKDEGPAGIFKQLDANGDGVLTMDEVPADKKTLAERLFRNADKNSDGKLTAEEFKAGLQKQPDPAPQRGDGAPGTRPVFGGDRGPQGQGAEQLWKMLDRNGTGSVKPADVPEDRRERFTRMLEMADANKDGALSKEEFQKFTSRMAPQGAPGRERPEGVRPESTAKDGERKPEGPRDGDRPQTGPRDGDKPAEVRRPDGDRPAARPEGRPEGRPEMRREGDRPATDRPVERPEMRREGERPIGDRPAGRPEFAPGVQRPAAGLFFILDTNRDGKLSREEVENAAKVLGKLDKNGDGELTPQEMMPDMRPEMRRPEGDRPATGDGFRPREGDRPSDRPAAREGDRPREGERRPEVWDGERRPAGPRDGDKPRSGDKPRDGDK